MKARNLCLTRLTAINYSKHASAIVSLARRLRACDRVVKYFNFAIVGLKITIVIFSAAMKSVQTF